MTDPVTAPATEELPAEQTDAQTDRHSAAPVGEQESTVGEVELAGDELDLDALADELGAIDTALTRLADGTYWTDEVTGEPLPDELLATDPLARRTR